MSRWMIDCTHSNLSTVLMDIHHQLVKGDVVGAYGTGGSQIEWTAADYAQISSDLAVAVIDQAFGPNVPLRSANVIDVEANAWKPGDVDSRMAESTAPRPTLYCAQETLLQVAGTERWRGDLWLAEISVNPPVSKPAVPEGFNLIGVQYAQNVGGLYDKSIIYDPYWPAKGPTVVGNPPVPQLPPGPWNATEDYAWKGAILTVIGADSLIHAYEYDLATGTWKRLDSAADTK